MLPWILENQTLLSAIGGSYYLWEAQSELGWM